MTRFILVFCFVFFFSSVGVLELMKFYAREAHVSLESFAECSSVFCYSFV